MSEHVDGLFKLYEISLQMLFRSKPVIDFSLSALLSNRPECQFRLLKLEHSLLPWQEV